jgi:hypothetical protein
VTNSVASSRPRQKIIAAPNNIASANQSASTPGFLEFDHVRAAMKNAQIEREKNQHAKDEARPMPRRDLNVIIYDLRFTIYAPTANGIVNRESP